MTAPRIFVRDDTVELRDWHFAAAEHADLWAAWQEAQDQADLTRIGTRAHDDADTTATALHDDLCDALALRMTRDEFRAFAWECVRTVERWSE